MNIANEYILYMHNFLLDNVDMTLSYNVDIDYQEMYKYTKYIIECIENEKICENMIETKYDRFLQITKDLASGFHNFKSYITYKRIIIT